MLRGVAAISRYAADLPAVVRWRADMLGIEPYFERPGYAEFRIGDHQQERGLIDRRYLPNGAADRPGGAIVSWHVDDLAATFAKLLAMGARTWEKPTERGPGFVAASAVDPFGNVLGVMDNRHDLDMLGEAAGA
jgi:predicted enzyme related to lactoylglutathione lyase